MFRDQLRAATMSKNGVVQKLLARAGINSHEARFRSV
jgi:hypothetical protein